MKWRGQRESSNIEDKRDQVTVIPDGAKLVDGSIYNAPKETENITSDPQVIKVVKELGKLNREKRTPTPTPKPKITKTQVTPDKWSTK